VETLVPITDDWRPAEAAVTPIERTDRPVIGALAAILGVHVGIFLYVAAQGFVRQPYSDMFDFLRAEFDFERGGDLIGYLASPHNHQHLVWVRLLTALDVQVFHGSALIFLIASSVSILIAAAVLAAGIWRGTPTRVVGAIGGLLAATLIVSAVNATDCTQPINSVYAIAFGFAVLAISLFERAGQDQPGRTVLFATLALTAAIGAVAGSAAGVAVFPVLIVSAARHPGARNLVAPTLLIGALASAIVLAALFSDAPGQSSSSAPGHAWKMIQYFVVYAGMPWSAVRLFSHFRLAVGLATIVIGAVVLWRGSRRGGAAGRLERVGLDLILFALITAAMAALGRVDENAAVVVPVRYAVFMSAFQVGVICVLAPALAERWARLKSYAGLAALAVGVALLAQQAAAGSSLLRTSHYIRSEIAAFQAGARRPEMRQLIHPDFNVAAQVQAECRRRGLYQ
jgi:hypothetical protein